MRAVTTIDDEEKSEDEDDIYFSDEEDDELVRRGEEWVKEEDEADHVNFLKEKIETEKENKPELSDITEMDLVNYFLDPRDKVSMMLYNQAMEMEKKIDSRGKLCKHHEKEHMLFIALIHT